MFCNNCGQQNPDNAASCSQCGNPLATTAFGQQPPTSTDSAAQQQVPYGVAQYGTMPQALPVTPQTNGKATASLICGVLSMTCFWFLTGIPAIVLGHMAKSEIRKSLGRMKGDGMAMAGLIMGYISVAAIPLVLIIAAIAIPNLLKSRIAANEASAVGSVRIIDTALITYASNNNMYPSDLSQLEQAGLIDSSLAAGHKSGYRFSYSSTGDHYFIVAMPVKFNNTGTRTFCSAEDTVIRVTTGEECTQYSPTLE